MESSIASEICVFPQISNVIRSLHGAAISSNNFTMGINILDKHVYTCGDNIVEKCQFGTTWGTYRYKLLSWDIVDRKLSISNFSYPLEKITWNGVDKILENKDDLIQQILEFICTVQNVTPPFRDDDIVFVNLIFSKHVFVSPQEFELIQARIFAKHYKGIEVILWAEVRTKINGLERGSSLYEEFQCLGGCVENFLKESVQWRTCFDENYERVLIESLTEQARKEFMSLPTVRSRSRIQSLKRAHLPQNELTGNCLICMESDLPGSEAYNMPCNHSFHLGCIGAWLLQNPSCPTRRYKLPSMEPK